MRGFDVSPLMGRQRGLNELERTVEGIAQQYQEADRVAKFVEFRNYASQVHDSALDRYGTDEFKSIEGEDPDYIKAAHEDVNRYVEDVRDPVLKAAMLREASQIQVTAKRQQGNIYENKRREHYQGVALEDKRRLELATINATPDEFNPTWPDAVQKNVAEYVEARKKEKDTGLWTAEQYDAHMKNYFKNVTVGYIEKDPGRAGIFLETYKDFMDPTDYVALKKAMEAEAGDLNVLDSYQKLYTEFGGDAYKMRAKLLNPETMKEMNLNARQVREVESLITDQEKTKRATYEQTESEYFKLLQEGKLKKSRILLDLNEGRIDAKGAEHWTKSIADTGVGDDPQAIIIMHDNIARGSIVEKGVVRPVTAQDIFRAPGISMKTKTALLDKFYQRTDKVTGEAEKQAKDYIKSQIISTGPLGSPIPAEHERCFKAYEALDKHADEARRQGKPWGIQEYMTYAKQLADFYRPTMESKVQDYQEMFGPRGSQAAQAPAAAPATQPAAAPKTIEKRKPGESVRDYMKRTGRE